MTGHDQTPGWDVHALVGAYAVDALDPDERAAFEAHLAQCAECRDEVDGLREAAALLGTPPVAPAESVRDAVLAGIQGIRPLPPVTDEPDDTDQLAVRRGRRSVRRVAAGPLLVAAAVALLLGVGAAWFHPWTDGSPRDDRTAAERVLAADDATTVDKRFPDGSTATIVVSRSEGRAVIRTTDMAPAPDGRVYELWLQTPAGEMEPAGLMPDLRDATVLLEGDASRATGVGITVEPDGGSEQPTSQPIAFFTLDS